MWESMGRGDPVGVGGRMWEIHVGKTYCTHVWTSKNKFKSLKIAKIQQGGQLLRNGVHSWPLFLACMHISADTLTLMTHTNMPTCRNSSSPHTNGLRMLTV